MIDASFASKRNEQLTIKTDSHFWRQMLISWFQVTRPQVGNWSLARLLDSASGSTTTHSLIKKKQGEQCPDLSGFENVEPVFLALSVSSLRLHQTLQLLLWNMNWNFRKQCWEDCEWQSQQGSPHCVQSVRRDNKTSKCAKCDYERCDIRKCCQYFCKVYKNNSGEDTNGAPDIVPTTLTSCGWNIHLKVYRGDQGRHCIVEG